ncbi:polyprotein [Elysia marginata]|uniref:Polyprotein n=1 Tax=Elysia marginata TaxID=1093978 RepID=A0AAV4GQA1_9GAST|nr:polyprotein [Elysia marginata]
MKSILEEYKCGLVTMLEDYDDPGVKTVQSSIKTSREWKEAEAIDEAKECLRLKEVIGQSQTDRKGLGSTSLKCWSKTEGKKRDIVIDEVRQREQLIVVERTVPYESRVEQAHTYKREKYLDLTKEPEESGYRAKMMPIEIGARGFAGSSAYDRLSKLSISGNKRTEALKLLAETAENSNRWIWCSRDD